MRGLTIVSDQQAVHEISNFRNFSKISIIHDNQGVIIELHTLSRQNTQVICHPLRQRELISKVKNRKPQIVNGTITRHRTIFTEHEVRICSVQYVLLITHFTL